MQFKHKGLRALFEEDDARRLQPIVADASVVINLIASGFSASILGCLADPLRVPREVRAEIERGRSHGHRGGDELAGLIAGGKAAIVELGPAGKRCFSTLVLGTAKDTLDDGEAATIAYAVEHGATILIDEKKATRFCEERFSHLTVGNTVDLVAYPAVRAKLGADLADAIFNMLIVGRMRVSPRHLDWVVEQIGPHRAAQCPSLPARYRTCSDVNG